MKLLSVLLLGVSLVSQAQAQSSRSPIKPITAEKMVQRLQMTVIDELNAYFPNGKDCKIQFKPDPLAGSFYLGLSSGTGYHPEQSVRIAFGSRWLLNETKINGGTKLFFYENARVRYPVTIELVKSTDYADFDLKVFANGKTVKCSFRE
jgi:hypothetical protein